MRAGYSLGTLRYGIIAKKVATTQTATSAKL
jgi:hypothetical protein